MNQSKLLEKVLNSIGIKESGVNVIKSIEYKLSQVTDVKQLEFLDFKFLPGYVLVFEVDTRQELTINSINVKGIGCIYASNEVIDQKTICDIKDKMLIQFEESKRIKASKDNKVRFSESEEFLNSINLAFENGMVKPMDQAWIDFPDEGVDDETAQKIIQNAIEDGYIIEEDIN
jgi:hypothetical protein